MPKSNIQVKTDVRGIRKFNKAAAKGPFVVAAVKSWKATYTKFAVKRYKKFSRGGGDWAALKPATIKSKVKNKRRILVEHGTLLEKLALSARRTSTTKEMFITAGFDGRAGSHPGSGLSIKQLATAHQLGYGKLPARPIIVSPPPNVIKKMAKDMNLALRRTANATRN